MNGQVLAKTLDMDRDKWLELRRQGIGGSDAAAVAGLNPWKSPVEVWLEKTGQITEQPDNEKMYWGRVLEDIIAQEFSRRTGLKVWRRNAILQHPEYPFMIANIDRRIVGKEEGLECKTASEYVKDQWKDDNVPDMYIIQCQHYMAVTGAKAWWIAVLIGGNCFKYTKIERDEEIIEYLIKIESDFWRLVEENTPPEPDGSEASTQLLARLYPEAEPESRIRLPLEAKDLIRQYEAAKLDEQEARTRKEEAANKLKAMLKDKEVGLIGDREVRWKSIISTRFDTKRFKKDHPDLYKQYVKESEYRRFEIR